MPIERCITMQPLSPAGLWWTISMEVSRNILIRVYNLAAETWICQLDTFHGASALNVKGADSTS